MGIWGLGFIGFGETLNGGVRFCDENRRLGRQVSRILADPGLKSLGLPDSLSLQGFVYGTFRKLGYLIKIRVPYFGVLVIRILLFRVQNWGPLFSETPIWVPLNKGYLTTL